MQSRTYYELCEEVKEMEDVNTIEYALETVNLYSQVFITDTDCKENKINFERI